MQLELRMLFKELWEQTHSKRNFKEIKSRFHQQQQRLWPIHRRDYLERGVYMRIYWTDNKQGASDGEDPYEFY